jgi:hypothetical protein
VNPTRDINKTFLKNTIRNIESHNRREETADCWRQHELQQQVYENKTRKRKVLQEKSSSEKMNQNVYDSDRRYWAELKVRFIFSSFSDHLNYLKAHLHIATEVI